LTDAHEQDEEEFALKAILVAGFTLLDIFNYLWDPPIMKKLFEILNWHTYPLLSFFVLYVFSYLALMAQPWQYPYLILILVTTVGMAAAAERNFDDVKVFATDKSQTHTATDKSGALTDKEGHEVAPSSSSAASDTKSYTEMYKEMKAIALSMEKSVSF
jgi:hypothetical protein